MALRRQLLILASLTLALPWAGCEYIREMEAGLREGQQAALEATALAVEARLRSDREMLAEMVTSLTGVSRFGAASALYAHRLPGPVVVDGYDDEWRGLAIPFQALPGPEPLSRIALGSHGDSLYAFTEVADSTRRFFDPSAPAAQADHLVLQIGEQMMFRLLSAAPGPLSVERYVGHGIWEREHRLRGIWNEREKSYALELRMPLSWGQEGLAVSAWDGTEHDDPPGALRPQALLREEYLYSEALEVFARPGVRLSLVAEGGWIVGAAGGLAVPMQDGQTAETVARKIVRWILGQPDYPYLLLDEPGRMRGDELVEAGDAAWYRWSDSLVNRVVKPIGLPLNSEASAPVLLLVAEQSMDSLHTLTTGAMGRLLWYTSMATLLAGMTLLAYASVLSWRIRRLSHAAQRVVDSDGRIRAQMPGSRSRDEIGDLARSYASLLLRLRHYNEYLETLGSKLSHELRTPLAIVRSSLDNLAELERSAQQQVYLERASEGATRLSKLLNAMGAASRLEQTLQQSERERVDLADLLAHLVESYRAVYTPRELVMTCQGEGPYTVTGAPELLAQMCDKLVENAADFTGAQGYIEFSLTKQPQEIRLQVINTGPAIPATLQGRLFDSLTSERTGKGDHLGLGLYVVRLIVEFHQGQVRAFNHPDGGKVVFEVLLPSAEPL
jgi:two-component system sensor histidine kinase ChvG